MTFYAGAGISKEHRKVPSLSARLGLSISRALFLMARSSLSQDTQLQSHGKHLWTSDGKGTFHENCVYSHSLREMASILITVAQGLL